MKVLAIVPARGGSKSIPRKNIKILNGKPLIAYSIEYANRCSLITKVVVSTDDQEIADISKRCGAEVPVMRPREIAEDLTPDFPVIKHIYDFFQANNEIFDFYVWLRPTSPSRPEGLIEEGIRKMIDNPAATSLRSVALCNEHPYRMWIKTNQYISTITEGYEPYNMPRQQLPEIYFQTGDLEIVRPETILNGSISGNRVIPLVIEPSFIDIDHEVDFVTAERALLGK